MNEFKHATAVQALLDEGKFHEAVELHNAHIKDQFDRARAGETINLTDLMAAKQTLDEAIRSHANAKDDGARTP